MDNAVEMLKILTECDLDNLLLLTGIVFMVIAVLGDISTWIRPGKVGRLSAAILSPLLLFGGTWIHFHEHVHQLKVLELAFGTENNFYEGSCPVDVEFNGQIRTNTAGTVLSEVEYSDGSKSPQLQIDFARPEIKSVKVSRRMERSGTENWARLKVISPPQLESEKTFFAVKCAVAPVGHRRAVTRTAAPTHSTQIASSQLP